MHLLNEKSSEQVQSAPQILTGRAGNMSLPVLGSSRRGHDRSFE
jgi:hypothetical protein